MNKKFSVKEFDKVEFINSGNEIQEVLEAKEYLKDIQMTINIGDVSDSLFSIEDIKNINKRRGIRVFSKFKRIYFLKLKFKLFRKSKIFKLL